MDEEQRMRRHIEQQAGSRGVILAVAVAALFATGCHTSLRRPPAVCQCIEDRIGDAVDHVGRSTSISNPTINHRTTRHYRSNPVTRALGRCIATGGPHCYPVKTCDCPEYE
jgi:hypothetical protein